MQEFYPFFIVLFAAVFFSTVFRRLHIPWVVALIIGGIIIGPHVFDLLKIDSTISLISQIGLVFLMFMAGLETKPSAFKANRHEIVTIAVINGLVPFFIGIGIGFLLEYNMVSSLLIGIIFISSSVAVIIPSLESNGILNTRLGRSIVSATVVQDAVSLLLLSLLLQTIQPITTLPLPLFYGMLVVSLIALRLALPRIQQFIHNRAGARDQLFQLELRTVFLVLIGTVIIFEALGMHPIIAGFFTGLVLSGSIKSKILKEKLHIISYGIFIPTFFLVLGAKIDISVFLTTASVFIVTGVIVVGSLFSKFLSGWIAGKVSGYTSLQSSLIGSSSLPQLSTTLAVAFTGAELGLLGTELVSAMIILSIVTVFISPILIRYLSGRIQLEIA